eukprot:5191045-Prymnesium_polylepis.1
MRGALQCTHPRGLRAAGTSAHGPCLAVVPRTTRQAQGSTSASQPVSWLTPAASNHKCTIYVD